MNPLHHIFLLLILCSCTFGTSVTDISTSSISKIEIFATNFSKQHKSWTDDTYTTEQLNKVFTDTLSKFYELNKDAFDNLALRLEHIEDSSNGRNMASFECWDHFVDSKRFRAHVYAIVNDSLRKKLSTGNYYFINGYITGANVLHNVGYNKTENSCDVGMVWLQIVDIIHSGQSGNTIVH